MQHTHHERSFQESGKQFAALINEQPDRHLTVTLRLPDGSLRVLPGGHFEDEQQALDAAHAFARELAGSC